MLELIGLILAASGGAFLRGRIARRATTATKPRRALHALKCLAGCTPGPVVPGLGVSHETDEEGNVVQLTPCKCQYCDRITHRRDPILTAEQIEQMRVWQALAQGKGGVAMISEKSAGE